MKILSVIVTYKPELNSLQSLIANLVRDSDVLVVDNGSNNSGEVEQLNSKFPSVTVVLLGDNQGLSKALNIGIRFAQKQGANFVTLFDQDSMLGENYLKNMLKVWEGIEAEYRPSIAALGPRIVSSVNGSETPFKTFSLFRSRSNVKWNGEESLFNTDFIITSGSFIPLDSFGVVGFMNEDYFIDNIDLEWCFRAKDKGLLVLGCNDVTLYHDIGLLSENPLVKMGVIKKHDPFRSYFTTRNRLDLYKKNYAPVGWKIRDFIRFVLKTIWTLVFSAERSEYRKYIWAGLTNADRPK